MAALEFFYWGGGGEGTFVFFHVIEKANFKFGSLVINNKILGRETVETLTDFYKAVSLSSNMYRQALY